MTIYELRQKTEDFFIVLNTQNNNVYSVDIAEPNKCTCKGFKCRKTCSHIKTCKSYKWSKQK